MITGKWIFDLKNLRRYDNMSKVFSHNKKAFENRLDP